jgi:hypothetical protein
MIAMRKSIARNSSWNVSLPQIGRPFPWAPLEK